MAIGIVRVRIKVRDTVRDTVRDRVSDRLGIGGIGHYVNRRTFS